MDVELLEAEWEPRFITSDWRIRVRSTTCGWRIIISPMIPQGSPSCYDSAMRNVVVLFIHLIAALARLLGSGGVRSIVAESLLLRHQLLIVNRSRQRSPNLSAWDRALAPPPPASLEFSFP